jgi:gas vesicle protein
MPGTGRDVTAQVKDTANQVKEEAKQRVSGVAAQAQSQVTSRIATQKDTTAQNLSGVASALRQTGQQLRSEDQTGMTDYIEQAADQVERLSSYLRDNDLGRLVSDAEYFARRQPALFLGGAFVLGLLGARFLKSSRPAPSYDAYTGYQMGERAPYGRYGSARGVYDAGSYDRYRESDEYNRYRSYLGDEYSSGGQQSSPAPRTRSYGEPLEE